MCNDDCDNCNGTRKVIIKSKIDGNEKLIDIITKLKEKEDLCDNKVYIMLSSGIPPRELPLGVILVDNINEDTTFTLEVAIDDVEWDLTGEETTSDCVKIIIDYMKDQLKTSNEKVTYIS